MTSSSRRLRHVKHPLVQHHVAELRDETTSSAEFRRLSHKIATLLASVATEDLELRDTIVRTPVADAPARVLSQTIALVPILRAGLALVDPLLNVIPTAEVWHLGLFRDEATAQPVEYYRKLPPTDPCDVALVLDPMLATGGSACLALEVLRQWGVPQTKLVVLIAAPEGIAAVHDQFPDTEIITAAVDECLNDRKFIVPGLGDAGDRLFNTNRS
ncbi:MAG: uracil phosphoribosyltransferase [Planctomycetota bacterium]|nr:uracil phosphoribosyltransferase [Planctomycetota bacterium]MDA1164801.1 uracil phosphoribosyltransferase [Planctomycetota bacterium]